MQQTTDDEILVQCSKISRISRNEHNSRWQHLRKTGHCRRRLIRNLHQRPRNGFLWDEFSDDVCPDVQESTRRLQRLRHFWSTVSHWTHGWKHGPSGWFGQQIVQCVAELKFRANTFLAMGLPGSTYSKRALFFSKILLIIKTYVWCILNLQYILCRIFAHFIIVSA